MYDIYGEFETQVKAGNCEMKHYRLYDKCDLKDGVYLSYEGIVVVQHGVFIAEFSTSKIKDKWGSSLDLRAILDSVNPFVRIVKEAEKKYENKEESL